MSKAVTASDIKLGLRRLYAQPEWALLFEVGDATGARHTRFADALAMSLWPSRGLTLHGIEIKVSRSDWQKERAQPEKAEKIAAYCDFWDLVTAPGVVKDLTEIPPAWGLIEFNGEKFTTRKLALKTDAAPIDRTFLAALLRRAHKADEAVIAAEVARRSELHDETFEARVEAAASRRAHEAEGLKRQVAEFEAASGIKLPAWNTWGADAEQLGRAAKAVKQTGITRTYDGLHELATKLRKASDEIEGALLDLGLAPPREPRLSDFARKRK
ncbi:hypothetical protein [Mesorhizobium sp. M2A.F.Ca.ET.039.01.1.1]|uniref:hypothetical protein n=1 Tax=Mesorhizobium sp. M2A.F.Ca.ET.039.01.1.1 TaxID=2496746 RepID=UPI000FCA7D2B|nr:hypothetical protein [Mesorhizobium sp. M2A.F.Ca.ET.039.01.1.1]RWX72514.1 hypothetical protein EOA24_00545 [Mesorhizobium sp. M2A.F.Ca.ET.039.01.1.1]